MDCTYACVGFARPVVVVVVVHFYIVADNNQKGYLELKQQ